MFTKVLIANRGAIACRIIRTLRAMGIDSLAVYSDADRHSLHVSQADEAVCVGPAPASESYLDFRRILEVAAKHGAQAIHPGYGFLSENAEFAEVCTQAGIVFIGPTPGQMRDFGLKHTARSLAQHSGVPLLPGSGLLDDLAHARAEALRIGYPVMLKSTAGGGGIGMQLCRNAQELDDAFHTVERLARSNFSQGGIFLEKYVDTARHIEVQIFGDGLGRVVALGERDCSLQRRNQKVVEETPAPGISDELRERLMANAVKLGEAVDYRSAGTVEYVYDSKSRAFYFLEVNTRLQVEHGVTEQVTGIDLVEWMIRLAAGETGFLQAYEHRPKGCSVQARLYAEDPGKHFQPCAGLLSEVVFPDDVRIDTWVEQGSEVSANYDPMIAKLIATGTDRNQALARLAAALDAMRLYGIESNLAYLRQVVADDVFANGAHYTGYLDRFEYRPKTVDVISPGTQSIIVSWPGRTGFWDVGVPPSGPMDALALRLANRLLGNGTDAPGLELAVTGPTLVFNTDSVILLAGANMKAQLDGEAIGYWKPVAVKAGGRLKLGSISGPGNRAYLAVSGGFDVPLYMGSSTTFTLGMFGGHAGRALMVGDVLHLKCAAIPDESCRTLPADAVPAYSSDWNIRVMYGPHGAPDFFTDSDIATFFGTDYEVHYNSSRTGVRLVGPRPEWARGDGGEAGLHPSNIHDNAYAIGAVDFTGDMPIILGPDGPSLGGFVCPACIVQADLWKTGQLKPGDRVRFHNISVEQAAALEMSQQRLIDELAPPPAVEVTAQTAGEPVTPVLFREAGDAGRVDVCYRQAGDRNILVEYGPLVLDLELRFRAHALMQAIGQRGIEGILDLTPGIRSLQLHFDSRILQQSELMQLLREVERELPDVQQMEVPSRIVHLPLCWDDPSTQLAIEKYMQSVRPDAPWCPSNIEFIRRINGLESIDEVKDIVFDASYLVMGLGDVYLGAPVATPMDPRHRLVTTKYNPARTWTPENAVGIGGAYLCVYGMEGPGGYQFVGRTLQMWNRYRQTADFHDGRQWLLRFFDRIRFYEVSAEELAALRDSFPLGRFRLDIEQCTLKFSDYRQYLEDNADAIGEFKRTQQAAFEAERERWEQSGQTDYAQQIPDEASSSDAPFDIPAGCIAVASPVTSNVWKIEVRPGQRVEAGDVLVIVEAMKMEITIESDEAGLVEEVLCSQGASVHAGQALVLLRLDAEVE